MHAFWLTLLVPVAWLCAGRYLKSRSAWLAGAVLAFVGAIAWAATGANAAGSGLLADRVLSGLHQIVSSTDLPFLQLTIACFVGWRRCRATSPDPNEPGVAGDIADEVGNEVPA
jgi:hypothetical protein